MADLPPYPDSNGDIGDDTGVRPGRRSTTSTPPSTPRWVKVFGIIALALVLLVVILLLAGGGPGGHGPGRHIPSGGSPGGYTPPASASITEHGVQQL